MYRRAVVQPFPAILCMLSFCVIGLGCTNNPAGGDSGGVDQQATDSGRVVDLRVGDSSADGPLLGDMGGADSLLADSLLADSRLAEGRIIVPDGSADLVADPCSPAPIAGSFFALTANDGLSDVPLCRYKGSVILVVNIAAK